MLFLDRRSQYRWHGRHGRLQTLLQGRGHKAGTSLFGNIEWQTQVGTRSLRLWRLTFPRKLRRRHERWHVRNCNDAWKNSTWHSLKPEGTVNYWTRRKHTCILFIVCSSVGPCRLTTKKVLYATAVHCVFPFPRSCFKRRRASMGQKTGRRRAGL